MIVKILGLLIGGLVLGAGMYYRAKEKDDPESRKVYLGISVAGGLVAAVCALLLLL